MAAIEWIEGGVTAPAGFEAAGVACGVKQSGRKDLALLLTKRAATAAALFTRNGIQAAPVSISRTHAKSGALRAIVVNSGNANACTGQQGAEHALRMVRAAGAALGVSPYEVLVASTGIIGVPLPIELVERGISQAAAKLSRGGHADAAEAILTTDTFAKERAARLMTSSGAVSVGGTAKGSGMIAPNLATMLAFLTTDIAIQPSTLRGLLKRAADASFNAITVDGAMSTNDTVAILANGASGIEFERLRPSERASFGAVLKEVCTALAKLIVRDGEGATKFIEVTVTGAIRSSEARRVARAVAESPLVKAAFFGRDPNWGRIMAAIGSASADLDQSAISVDICGEAVVRSGAGADYDATSLASSLAASEVPVAIDLGRGKSGWTIWTSDLSYEYVRINAEYRT